MGLYRVKHLINWNSLYLLRLFSDLYENIRMQVVVIVCHVLRDITKQEKDVNTLL
jgi:hypothetical protein